MASSRTLSPSPSASVAFDDRQAHVGEEEAHPGGTTVASSSGATSPSESAHPTPTIAPAAAPPLESHIVDELQNISLTQTRTSTTGPTSAAAAASQKQKHSPRRRKHRTQEVEEEEDQQDGAAAVEPDTSAAQTDQADLPVGVVLRIPLPNSVHINKKQRTKQTSDGLLQATQAQPASKQRGDVLDSGGPHSLLRASSNASVASAASSPSVVGSAAGSIRCEACNKTLSSSAQLADHELGRKHINTVLMLANGGALRCEICDKVFTSTLDQSKHLDSAGHKTNVAQLQAAASASASASVHHMLTSPVSGAASVASGASSPFTVGAGSSQPYLLHASPTASSVSSPASSAHGRPHFPAQLPSLTMSGPSLHFCPLCRLRFPDAGTLAHHYAGPRHAATVFDAQQQASRLAQDRLQQQQNAMQHSMQQAMASAFQSQMPTWAQQRPMMWQPSPFQPQPPMHQFAAINAFQPQQSYAHPPQQPRPSFAFAPIPLGSSQMSIHEEPAGGVDGDGVEGHMEEEDSIAVGMAPERAEEAGAIETTPMQPIAEGDAAADPVIETAAQPSATLLPEESKEPDAGAVEGVGDAATAVAASASSDTIPLDDNNTSRKRKFGRYSPAINNPLVRPRLQDPTAEPVGMQQQQQEESFQQQQQQQQPLQQQPPHPSSAPSQFHSFPSFLPPNGAPMCTCALPALSGYPPQPCVFHSQPSQSSPWHSHAHAHGPPMSAMPHPECRAPHYIYVAVHVPSPMLQAPPPALVTSSMAMGPPTLSPWGAHSAPMQVVGESPDQYPMVTTTPPPTAGAHSHSHHMPSHRSPSQQQQQQQQQLPYNAQGIYHITLSPHQQQQQQLARPTQRRRASGPQSAPSTLAPSSRRTTPTTPTQPTQ